MPVLVIISFSLITTALIFYSIGVWSERFSRYLKVWHVWCFWIGFCFDIAGTLVMHMMAEGPFNILEPHTMTGQLALWLMLFHAAWATMVTYRGTERLKKSFHRYSLVVWFIWLIPYIGGIFIGISR